MKKKSARERNREEEDKRSEVKRRRPLQAARGSHRPPKRPFVGRYCASCTGCALLPTLSRPTRATPARLPLRRSPCPDALPPDTLPPDAWRPRRLPAPTPRAPTRGVRRPGSDSRRPTCAIASPPAGGAWRPSLPAPTPPCPDAHPPDAWLPPRRLPAPTRLAARRLIAPMPSRPDALPAPDASLPRRLLATTAGRSASPPRRFPAQTPPCRRPPRPAPRPVGPDVPLGPVNKCGQTHRIFRAETPCGQWPGGLSTGTFGDCFAVLLKNGLRVDMWTAGRLLI